MLRTATRLSFDAVDPALLGHFWAQVTGYRLVLNEPDEVRLQGDRLGVDELVFREVHRWKAAPNRVQVDLSSDDLDADTLHLESLGATRVVELERRGERRVVLRDPEGNEFALVARPPSPARPVPAPAVPRRSRARPSARGAQHGP